jgi:hypothetical protein
MTHPDCLDPDGWRIEDQPHGWILRYRPPVTRVFGWLPSVYGRVPKVWASSSVALACFFAAYAVLWGAEFYFLRNASFQHHALVFFGFLFFELFRQYVGYDIALNVEQRVVVENGRVNNGGGLFPEPCLRSVRLAPSKQRGNRWTLLFSGDSVSEAVLVGEPGLSEGAAQQVSRGVLARVEQNCANVPQQHCDRSPFNPTRRDSV